LHDSLDTNRSKTKAVTYKIERASDGGINYTLVIVGAMISIFGFVIYYFFPLSLLSFNLSLLLAMFFILLLGMLFGLTMLSLNVETLLETLFSYVFFWY
jgi:hypothetical protein